MTSAPSLRGLTIAALVSSVTALTVWIWGWSGGLPYDHTSGVWLALADDLTHGDFYRPVFGSLGYGGTRYVPLFFILLAGLIKCGLMAPLAGAFMTFASLGLLSLGAHRLMRELGATPPLAWIGVGLLPASIALQLLGLATKGDLLATAFSVWGALAALRWQATKRRRFAGLAGLAFAAALLTKFTAGFAFAATALWLLHRRQPRSALSLVLGTGTLTVTLLWFANLASEGRMAASFAACATGGLDGRHALLGPWWFLRVVIQDPFAFAIIVAGCCAALRRWRHDGVDWIGLTFATTAAGTVLLFTTPGADSNHLLDLIVASIVLAMVEVARRGLPVTAARLAIGFALAIAATWLPGVPSVRHHLMHSGRPTTANLDALVRQVPQLAEGPLLSENPLVPLLLGQRPIVLDPFNLRLVARQTPDIHSTFFADLAHHRFATILLMDWSGAPLEAIPEALAAHRSLGANHFYGEVHFPPGFLEALQTHYRPTAVVHPFVVFEPRRD